MSTVGLALAHGWGTPGGPEDLIEALGCSAFLVVANPAPARRYIATLSPDAERASRRTATVHTTLSSDQIVRLARYPRLDIIDQLVGEGLHCPGRRPCNMRCKDKVGTTQLEQRIAVHWRFNG